MYLLICFFVVCIWFKQVLSWCGLYMPEHANKNVLTAHDENWKRTVFSLYMAHRNTIVQVQTYVLDNYNRARKPKHLTGTKHTGEKNHRNIFNSWYRLQSNKGCVKAFIIVRQYYIYSEAIKSIQFLVLNTGSYVLKCLYCHFVKRLPLQNTNSNCFAVINKGVKVLSSNSVVPIKTRFCTWQMAFYTSRMSSADVWVKPLHYLLRNSQKTASNSIRNATCLKLSPFELKL